MPELPEVETTKNGLLPHINGKTIQQVNIYFPRLRFPIPTNLPKLLTGKKLNNILRRGKYLIFNFTNGDLVIHLGMSGKIEITAEKNLKKHDHFELIFEGLSMRLNDPRRFGCVLWTDDYLQHKLIKNMGIEPLTNDFDEDYLFTKSRKRNTNIKTFIMDGRVVVGVGNIYACESLFKAQINPTTPANKVSKKNYVKLTKIIKQTLQIAIKNGGTTLQDFANVNGELGYFAQKLQVYGREKENCNSCSAKILRIIQNQRSTFYCPSCQK